MNEFSETDVARWVAEELGECPVETYHTGGGVSTVFIGSPRETDDGAVFWMSAGPGWFADGGWASAMFSWEEFYVGPDTAEFQDVGRYVASEAEFRVFLREQRAAGDWRDQ